MPARPRFAPRKPGAPSIGRRRGATVAPKTESAIPDGLTSDEELAELLASLTGKEVKVARGPVLEPGPALPVCVAHYADEEGQLGALLMADIAAAAGMAAALTLMPAGSVTEAMRFGQMDEALLENWGEIANIATQVVRCPGFPNFKLTGNVQSMTGLTPPVEALIQTAKYKVGWTVQVPQYANGRISIMLHREE